MSYIVIAMAKNGDAIRLKDIIQSGRILEEVIICQDGSDVLRVAREQEVNLVICTSRLSDMSYEELVSYLKSSEKMLMLTREPTMISMSDNIRTLQIPFKSSDFLAAIKSLIPTRYYERAKGSKKRSLEDQMRIDSAKQLIMKQERLSEPEAHRYLQKISMDTGLDLVQIARQLLNK